MSKLNIMINIMVYLLPLFFSNLNIIPITVYVIILKSMVTYGYLDFSIEKLLLTSFDWWHF